MPLFKKPRSLQIQYGASRDQATFRDPGNENTTVSQNWIANALGMKSAANVSRQIYVFRRIDGNTLAPRIRKRIEIKNL